MRGRGKGRGQERTLLEFADQRRPGAVWQYVQREDGQWFMRYINSKKYRYCWDESRVGPVDDAEPKLVVARIELPKSLDFDSETQEEVEEEVDEYEEDQVGYGG